MLNIWTSSIARAAGVEVPADKLNLARGTRRQFRPVHGLATAVRRWRERRETRQALQRLDDRLLADIGLSRAMIDSVVDDPSRYRAANENFPLGRLPANDNRPVVSPREML